MDYKELTQRLRLLNMRMVQPTSRWYFLIYDEGEVPRSCMINLMRNEEKALNARGELPDSLVLKVLEEASKVLERDT